MKKILALLLTLVLCISASVTVFAASPAVSADNVKAERGDLVYVTLKLSDCASADAIAVEYEFDNTVLKKVLAKSSWTKTGSIADFEVSNHRGSWCADDAVDVNGEICKLAFQVLEGAEIDETEVTCKVILKNGATPVGTYTTTAKVEVTCTHVMADDATGTKVDDTNHSYECELCESDVLEAHTWNNGVITKVPTETATGIKEYTCTFCKATKEEELPVVEPEIDFDDDDEDEDDNQGGSGDQGGTTPTPTPEPETPSTSKPSKPAKPATKPGNSQQGTTTPEASAPAVEIKDAVVRETVEEIKKAEEGKEVVIEMKQEDGKVATVVPVEILDAVKGKDVDVVLDMGEYSWVINGKDVAESGLKDINLEVKLDSKAIKEDVVKDVAGKDATRQISLTHNGEFNFKAKLNINVGKEFAGKFGNLYYYNNGKLEFMNAGKVDENGNVALEFGHASDYVVVLGEDRTADELDNSDVTTPEVDTEEPGDDVTTGNNGGNAGPIVAVVGVIAAIAVAAFFFLKKK